MCWLRKTPSPLRAGAEGRRVGATRRAKRNFEVGTTTVTDSREAQARFDLVGAQEIAADNDLRVKKLALDQLVGSPGAQPVRWRCRAVAQRGARQRGGLGANGTRPATRRAPGGLALDVARLETRKAETGHRPTIDLQASYAIQHNPNGTVTAPHLNTRTNNATVGVALNLPCLRALPCKTA